MAHLASTLIGVISDTHGLLRPRVHDALKGAALIIHAGDVGGSAILDELRLIAPVLAVLGNTDPHGEPELSEEILMNVDDVSLHVSHGHECGSPTPQRLADRYDADVVVYGHTHRPLVTKLGGQLFVNPGAAGPKRFNLAPSVARLTISGGSAEVEIVEIA